MQVTAKRWRHFVEVHDQNLLHATLLKAVFALSEEFQRGLFVEIYCEYSWQQFQFFDKKWWQYSSTLDTNSVGASSSL